MFVVEVASIKHLEHCLSYLQYPVNISYYYHCYLVTLSVISNSKILFALSLLSFVTLEVQKRNKTFVFIPLSSSFT